MPDMDPTMPFPVPGGSAQFVALGAQLVEKLLDRLQPQPPGRAAASARTYRRLRLARRRNALVAAALGACRCWGLRSACPLCGGDGRPGFFQIDPEAFATFVAPAIAAQPEAFAGRVPASGDASPQQSTDEE